MYAELATPDAGLALHLCLACKAPIAAYGRLAPCLHTFCLACAASMARCRLCHVNVTKLERVPPGTPMYIHPDTMQGFRSKADYARALEQTSLQAQSPPMGAPAVPRPPANPPPPPPMGPGKPPPPPYQPLPMHPGTHLPHMGPPAMPGMAPFMYPMVPRPPFVNMFHTVPTRPQG
ncbi:hypothetical protein ACKKBF_B21035 [Auxenochlorella protothecoides x Auxenochlorella symbiontica]